ARPTPQFNGPPPMTIDAEATYLATIETSCGSYVAELRPDIAPVAVNSFVFLAQKGFYDGLTFHRILKGFVIQGGDPLGDGSGGPGYRYEIETSPKQTFDAAGLLAMANSGQPGSSGSQFFVTLDPTPDLDPVDGNGGYTIFGEVTKGLDVVERIGKVATTRSPATGEPSVPTQAVYIESVTIEERPA
ncbi:MAG TPA: peptidylprolyl isomerase, partial [Actinomycetota bacterium]